MAPTLPSGKLVVAVYPLGLRPGSIVVFTHQGREKIKRIARMEKGRFFVVGDNPPGSTDSRDFGWIDRSQIVGKVILTL
jgi:phage repressor protein C with HTH and peptisase S24 domain